MKKLSLDVLRTVSEASVAPELSSETARDALSIVLDAVNSAIGGMIITDLNGVIRFSNPAFRKMFEYSSEEVEGVNAAELFATREVRSLPDVIAIIDISKDDTEEFVVESKDGRRFVVEVSASNVTSSTGQLAGRMASFVDVTRRKRIESDRENLIGKLREALANIKTLRGIVPICCSCKKIRDDKGFWNQVESYVQAHSEATFSHGICPDCAKKLYPEFFHENDWHQAPSS